MLDDSVDAALATEDAARLKDIVASVDWRAEGSTLANRILQRIALYGCSGRTERYRDVIDRILADGCELTLSSCASPGQPGTGRLPRARPCPCRSLLGDIRRLGRRRRKAANGCLPPDRLTSRGRTALLS